MKKLYTFTHLSVAGLIAAVLTIVLLDQPEMAVAQPLADVTAFSQNWESITPHDSNELDRQPRAIHVCDDGDDTIETGEVSMIGWQDTGSTPVTFTWTEGNLYPFSPRILRDTGTDHTCFVAVY